MILPLSLSFRPVALLVGFALGAILTGTSLGLTAQRPSPSRSHSGFDHAQTVLGLTTRYVVPD